MSWLPWNLLCLSKFRDCLSATQLEKVDKLETELEASMIQYNLSIIQQHVSKCRTFHYFVIMAISAASTDEKTRVMYNRIMDGISGPRTLLESISKLESFLMFHDGLTELLRVASLSTARVIPKYLKQSGGVFMGFQMI